MLSPQAGSKSGLQNFRKLKACKGIVDICLVDAATAILKADSERSTVGSQGGESKAPALRFSQPLAQLVFIADFHTRLLE